MNRLETAYRYADMGIPLFPVTQDKLPAIKQWEQQATTDKEQLAKWFHEKFIGGCNFGCCPGRAGLIVIDTDRHSPEQDGEESLKKLQEEFGGTFPETFTVRTPSGGIHRYYKASGYRSKNKFRLALDVKSTGGYVVAAGAVSPKGEYTIIRNSPFADAPEWFLTAYNKKVSDVKKDTTFAYNTIVSPDSEENIDLAIGIIQDWPFAIEGERNSQLYMLMREICKCGVTISRALELYAEYGIDVIGLDADSSEVQATIKSAYGDMSDFGSESYEVNMHKLDHYFDVVESEDEPAVFGTDWTQLEQRKVPERRWFIKNWLSADKGYTVLFSGQGGTGKSCLILDLMRSLATGEAWCGKEVLRGAKCMYISCEESEEELARRIQYRVNLGKRVPENIIRVVSRLGMDNLLCTVDKSGKLRPEKFYRELKQGAEDFFGNDGGVLILDTLSDIFGGDENNRNHVSQFVKFLLNKLGQDLRTTIIVLAHPGKSNAGFSGSSAWEGSFRCRWEIGYAKDVSDGLLKFTLAKSNTSKAGEYVLLQNKDGVMQQVSEAQQDDWAKNALVELIDEAYQSDNPFGRGSRSSRPIEKVKVGDIFEERTLTEEEISDLVAEMLAEGLIEVHKNGEGRNVLRSVRQ